MTISKPDDRSISSTLNNRASEISNQLIRIACSILWNCVLEIVDPMINDEAYEKIIYSALRLGWFSESCFAITFDPNSRAGRLFELSDLASIRKPFKVHRLDPMNPAVFEISQILAQKSIKNGFITEARDYMKVAHAMARDEETKFRLGKELEILEISADIYRKPTNEFEVVGKTLLEAELAPG